MKKFGNLSKSERTYFKAEIKRTKHPFPPNSKVLEVGFGGGTFLRFAKERQWEITGTEINRYLVKAATENGYNVINTNDLSNIDDNSFDLVVAFDVLEHIDQADLLNFTNEVYRILKKGGSFIARFPNGDSPFGLRNQNGDITHVTIIGSGKVNYLAEKCNMEIIYLGGVAHPIIGVSLVLFIHRLIFSPLKKILNLVINIMFFPGHNIAFCDSNLVLIFRK